MALLAWLGCLEITELIVAHSGGCNEEGLAAKGLEEPSWRGAAVEPATP
jgi:hypothetical protein